MASRLQIFVSSTYLDLKEERQSAVEAILKARHIPAGMELFAAGSASQLEVIKKWIDESDAYMLILGHRYGSIEPQSGLSYVQVEYEYALSREKPIFAVVATDAWRLAKQRNATDPNCVVELDNRDKFRAFREAVQSRICRFFDDTKDIQIQVHESVQQMQRDYSLVGWVRGDLLRQEHKLRSELTKTKEALEVEQRRAEAAERRISRVDTGVNEDWDALFTSLMNIKVDLLKLVKLNGGDTQALQKQVGEDLAEQAQTFMAGAPLVWVAFHFADQISSGVEISIWTPPADRWIYDSVLSKLRLFDLIEDASTSTGKRAMLSARGRQFFAWMHQIDFNSKLISRNSGKKARLPKS